MKPRMMHPGIKVRGAAELIFSKYDLDTAEKLAASLRRRIAGGLTLPELTAALEGWYKTDREYWPIIEKALDILRKD